MTNKTLKFVLVKNNLPGAKEPYNGQFVSNGTTWLDGFCEKICKGRTNIDAPTLKLILRTAFTFIAEDMAENVFRYNTGLLTFEPMIEGSLPSMDAPLTDENPLVIAVRLAGDLIREIGAVVPTRDSDDAISVKIDDVLDVEAEKYHQVTGGKLFQLTGKNISARGEGEGVEVAGPDGIARACAVLEEDGMGQRIIAEAPSDTDPGKGAILLTTRGYATPDAEPMLVKKPVTILAAPPKAPKITHVANNLGDETLRPGCVVEIIGENFEGATVKASHLEGGVKKEYTLSSGVVTVHPTKIVLGTDWYDEAGLDSRTTGVTFTVTTADGSDSHDSPFEGD